MQKIGNGAYITDHGLVLSAERRRDVADVFGVTPESSPITLSRDVVRRVLKDEARTQFYCDEAGDIVAGRRARSLALPAVMIVDGCGGFERLERWLR